MHETTVTIRLRPSITEGRAHVAGIVVVDGAETAFSGWMELLGLLEAHVDQQVLVVDHR